VIFMWGDLVYDIDRNLASLIQELVEFPYTDERTDPQITLIFGRFEG